MQPLLGMAISKLVESTTRGFHWLPQQSDVRRPVQERKFGKYHINLNQSESIWINLKQLLDRAVGQHGHTPSHTFLSSEHEGSDCLSIHLPVHHAHSVLPSLRNRPIGCAMFLMATHLHKLNWLQWCSKEGIYTPTPELQHQDWWRKQHTGTDWKWLKDVHKGILIHQIGHQHILLQQQTWDAQHLCIYTAEKKHSHGQHQHQHYHFHHLEFLHHPFLHSHHLHYQHHHHRNHHDGCNFTNDAKGSSSPPGHPLHGLGPKYSLKGIIGIYPARCMYSSP